MSQTPYRRHQDKAMFLPAAAPAIRARNREPSKPSRSVPAQLYLSDAAGERKRRTAVMEALQRMDGNWHPNTQLPEEEPAFPRLGRCQP